MYNLRRKIGFKITKLNSKDEPSSVHTQKKGIFKTILLPLIKF